ncbi:hypothetical protein HLK59_29170 [Streptomyces sp. S3(2020)]|uniref:hypothetical protein n=1 Tax=Streptomyces sp. S3(2020) TaxID=2732044 RepID=UPI001489EADC|nr:hypothetical protein [Streptomyces sp. S3(2020)]NNN34364.1 hypothetical protein [Streptomyces sp. S3(2020)]
MRALSARRLASAAVTATLLIGITAPAAVAVDSESKRERVEEAAKAPLPGVDGLLAQTKTLGDLGGLLAPVTDVLNAVLKADDGQISPDLATQLLDALKAAIAKILAVVPVPVPVPLPTDPPATTVPTTPPATTTPEAPLPLPVPVPLPALPLPADKSADDAKAPSADAVGDALTALQTAVSELLAAATSGDPTKVVPAATAVVSSLLNAILALLLGGGLPLPLPVDLPVPVPPVPLPLPLPAS